jgi:hypothetical protein
MTPDIYAKLLPLKTSTGYTINDLIQCGCSTGYTLPRNMGVMTGDPECYTVFAPLLNPIIRDYHDFSESSQHVTDLDPTHLKKLNQQDLDPKKKYILSSRIRVSRSIEGIPFPAAASRSQMRRVESLTERACQYARERSEAKRSEREEEPERTICGRSGLRWGLEGSRAKRAQPKSVLLRRKRAAERASEAKRARRRHIILRQKPARSAERASGASERSEASKKKAYHSAAEAGSLRRHIILRQKQARSASKKKAYHSAAEAGSLSEQEEGISFYGRSRLAQRAQQTSVLLLRKRAAERTCARSHLAHALARTAFSPPPPLTPMFPAGT